MTTSKAIIYRPYVSVTRNVATVRVSPGDFPAPEPTANSAAVSAGVRVRRVNGEYVGKPLRQNAIIETSVQYVGVMSWRRQVVEISTPELPVVEDGGSGVAAMGLTAVGVGYVMKSGSGIAAMGLTAEAVGSRPSNGSGTASMQLTAEAEGEAPAIVPAEGSGVASMGLTAEAVGSRPSNGSGTAAMGLTAEGEGEAPAVGSSVPVVEAVSAVVNEATSVSSITFDNPSGTVSGEDLFALVQLSANRTLTLPTDWVEVYNATNIGAGRAALIRKRAGGSEPSTYTISFSGTATASVCCARISGVNATTPVNASSVDNTSATAVAPTVTTTVGNCLILRCYSIARTRTLTAPGSSVELWNSANTNSAQSVATEEEATAGATGTVTFSSSGTHDRAVTATVALAPI